jgi:putative tryptophan/tyrosine transport system substrate-binding protein
MMRRRDFITLLGGAAAAAWPVGARAQQQAMPVVGYFNSGSPAALSESLAALRHSLREAGFVDGRNVRIEARWAEGRYERLTGIAAELVAQNVAILVATGGEPAALAAKAATTTIPVVFLVGADPVQSGLVQSLARPGGNLTGMSLFTSVLEEKRVGLLYEMMPRARRLALLVNPEFTNAETQGADARAATGRLGIELVVLSASNETQIDHAFEALPSQRPDALLVAADPLFNSRRERIVALAARAKLPAFYQWREFPQAGGLISYGTSLSDAYRQVGVYVARVLRGARPADLPVLQPTEFELVINLTTAKTLGLEIPPMLLARADEVIE